VKERRLGNLATSASVQKLQTALHAKAKTEAEFRFYALYDKIYREDILAHAYAQCRSNKGAPGVDGQDFSDVEASPRSLDLARSQAVRTIGVAGVLCWVAALFYFIYIKNYEAPGFLILVVFFGYFTSQRNWGGSDNASNPFKCLQQDGGSPIRELAKGLGCVVVGTEPKSRRKLR
jgi:hypothetical protein